MVNGGGGGGGGGGGQLTPPTNLTYADNTLLWDSVVGATEYTVELIDANSLTIVTTATVMGTSMEVNSLADGDYTFTVKASDGTNQSSPATSSFKVGSPLLSPPTNISVNSISP